MASSQLRNAQEVQQQLDTLAASLMASQEQLRAQADVFLQCSNLKASLGDHVGALDYAKRASSLFPQEVKYLIRASQALLQSGRPDKAYKALQDARSATDAGQCSEDILATLESLDRTLRPLHYLPEEILITIFEYVHEDWVRLPSPFQLLHVCRRWREAAIASPSLWRDMRMLRIPGKVDVKHDLLWKPVSKIFCFNKTAPRPQRMFGRRGCHQWRLMRTLASFSCDTLTHYELELNNRDGWGELIQSLVDWIAGESLATLQSIAFIDKNQNVRRPYMPGERHQPQGSLLATVALDIVLSCPRLRTVELMVGELLFTPRPNPDLDSDDDDDDEDSWEYDFKCLDMPNVPTASFVDLKLDNFDGFNGSRGSLVRDCFLRRCSELRSLTIADVPSFDLQEFPANRPAFAHQLLVTCAGTLARLEVSGRANVFKGVLRAGATTFPQLRHFRHVSFTEAQDAQQDDMEGLSLPNLQSTEAPISIVKSLPDIPDHVTVRLDRREKFADDCRKTADWLLSLGHEEGPRSLSILITFERPSAGLFARGQAHPVEAIIASLTPSIAEKVACGNLQELGILCRAAVHRDLTDTCSSLDPMVLPKPCVREEWEKMRVNASKLIGVADERRRLSRGLPPTTSAATSGDKTTATAPHEGSCKKVALTTEVAKVWPDCEALQSIVVEGCFVQPEVWQLMKTSESSFSVTPNPDEMLALPSEEEFNEKARRFGQPEVHPW